MEAKKVPHIELTASLLACRGLVGNLSVQNCRDDPPRCFSFFFSFPL